MKKINQFPAKSCLPESVYKRGAIVKPMHFHVLLQSKVIFLLEVFCISILIFQATKPQANTQSLFHKYEKNSIRKHTII